MAETAATPASFGILADWLWISGYEKPFRLSVAIAELIAAGFEPWAKGMQPQRILEIGTGSGCIAVACALAFPEALVVATDISADALAVARQNVAHYQLEDRVQLLEADLFDGVMGSFDLIVTNPPYVPLKEVQSLPEEYTHEPTLALASGEMAWMQRGLYCAMRRHICGPTACCLLKWAPTGRISMPRVRMCRFSGWNSSMVAKALL